MSYLSYNYGDIREKLTSTNPDDKYIVLDKDSKVQLGYSAYETVEISSDKVLDLNGHTIQINDIRNKANGSDKFYQSDNSAHFNTVMFSITNSATLTIIDSGDDGSGNGTGEIYVNAYMVNPYKYSLKRYTTRDIFEVDDGNLVIYGGTFQAEARLRQMTILMKKSRQLSAVPLPLQQMLQAMPQASIPLSVSMKISLSTKRESSTI